ncbi:energy transducer TonB [Algoriphagus sediminis]|uniref:Energy transducer TonB n=1 Tax=Algoriphagus sediminis TaxID=3057113 RepID=A0ABT7YAJ2_9BACT|nr:energy transducer TonB [Algoriphagus sediminis]MDN3203456.1 energy transducer TonB [Algoriphagus sediminis]
MKTKPTIQFAFFGLLIACLFMLAPQDVQAQSNETVYEEVDQMPEYPGGMQGLVDFMVQNLKYPKEAKEAGVQGTVMITFHVEKDGSVSNAQIAKGIASSCDNEALRIVNQMENWTPGKKDGKDVITKLTLPVKFAL